MHRTVTVSLVACLLFAGCVTIEGRDGLPPTDPTEPVTPGPNINDSPSTDHDFPVAKDAAWALATHRFRVPFDVDDEAGSTVRTNVAVTVALDDAGLRWVGPGIPVQSMQADPASVVLYRAAEDGSVSEIPVAAAATSGGVELQFEHMGGPYLLYVEDAYVGRQGSASGAVDGDNPAPALLSRGQWQGTGMWGVVAISSGAKIPAGSHVSLQGRIQNDAQDMNGDNIPVQASVTARAPDDWTDVVVDPEGVTDVRTRLSVDVEGTTPDDATEDDEVFLDVVIEGVTVAATFKVSYLPPPQ